MSALQTCLLVLMAFAACTLALGPVYELEDSIRLDVTNRDYQQANNLSPDNPMDTFSEVEYYEWEGYDGWFNNPAHPEWGAAGKFCNKRISHYKLKLVKYHAIS